MLSFPAVPLTPEFVSASHTTEFRLPFQLFSFTLQLTSKLTRGDTALLYWGNTYERRKTDLHFDFLGLRVSRPSGCPITREASTEVGRDRAQHLKAWNRWVRKSSVNLHSWELFRSPYPPQKPPAHLSTELQLARTSSRILTISYLRRSLIRIHTVLPLVTRLFRWFI